MTPVDDATREVPIWIPWDRAEIADDGRTVTVHYRGDFSPNEIRPTLKVEYRQEAVVIGLTFHPLADDLGVMLSGPSSPSHTIAVVLDEPVGERRFIDPWKPPEPPPLPLWSIVIGTEFQLETGNRKLIIDRINIYDDCMSVDYRLRPGEQTDEDTHLLWDLDVEDDLSTHYEVPSGAYGSGPEEVVGDRDVRPAPPTAATLLTVVVYGLPATSGEYLEIGRVQVDLPNRVGAEGLEPPTPSL